jgi:hypothetical protein
VSCLKGPAGLLHWSIPPALHVTERHASNQVEADHGRLKSRLRPVRGLKRHRSARISVGSAAPASAAMIAVIHCDA